MSETDNYEIVRQKLVLGPLQYPKQKSITELLKILWNEKEIKILTHFLPADKWTSLKLLEEKTNISKRELKQILARSVDIGTISKIGSKYCLDPIIPGIFEKYFQRRRDTEENQLKVARLFREIIKNILPLALIKDEFRLFRPLLPLKAKEKLIEINESFDVQTQALPYELVEKVIEKNSLFAVIPCQCRLIAELDGEPCEVAPAEMGCFVAGVAAQMMISLNVPGLKQLTKEEAIKFLKETEKKGLVHNAIPDKGFESSLYFCNCCSCHCGVLAPGRKVRLKGAYQSNYSPKFYMELCSSCEICVKKCPSTAIHPISSCKVDSRDNQMIVKAELCIGCGVCAVSCPNSAIKLVKVRDVVPPEKFLIGNKTFTDLLL